MKHYLRIPAKLGLAFFLLFPGFGMADDLSQTFTNWPTSPVTSAFDGWSVAGGAVVQTGSTNLTANSLKFKETIDGSITLPYVSNSAASISYYVKSTINTNIWVQQSSNGTDWNTLTNQPVTGGFNKDYFCYTNAINRYGGSYYRLVLMGQFGTGTAYMDDIRLTSLPTLLQLDSVTPLTTLGLSEIYVTDPVNITAVFSSVEVASNIQMTLYYKFGAGGTTYSNAMASNSPSSFVTSTPVPGQPSEGTVYYYINATFQGPSGAVSPTNFPAGGFSGSPYSYSVATRPYTMQNNSMAITGTINTNMNILADYVWDCLLPYSSSPLSLRFEGSNTILHTWGDTNQVASTPAFEQTAELTSTPITISPSTNSGQLLIKFFEQSSIYSVKEVDAEIFDAWSVPTPGTYTNNGWILYNGLTSASVPIRFRNTTVGVLESNTVSWLQSPYLPRGVGEISFWYRNFNTNGIPVTGAIVEKSITGGTDNNEWTPLTAITNIGSGAFSHQSILLSDPRYHYIRIRNSTNLPNARLCLDDVLVAQPGATVGITNVTHLPATPTVFDPVTVNATLTPAGGASNLTAKIWYRTGSTGTWTSVTMTNIGSAYSQAIPSARGDKNGGAGTVEYFLECAYLGYESTYSSPAFYPLDGSNSPNSFIVQSATVQISNPATEPGTPVLESTTQLRADVSSFHGASNIQVTAYYRLSPSGSFIPLTMTLLSNNTYRTTGSIPAQTSPGTILQYYFGVTFLGPDAQSPSYLPPSAEAEVFNTYFRLVMQNNSVSVTGTVNSAMFVAGPNLWEAFVPYSGSSFTNRFLGASNSTIRLWGDATQAVTLPPFTQTGALNDPAFVVNPTTNAGTLLYRFNENTLDYTIKQVTVQTVNPWDLPSTTTATNNGWVVNQGFTASNVTLQLPDRSLAPERYLVLESNTMAWVSTPRLPDGIGEISFWHRNFALSGQAAQLLVEKSSTGGTNNSEWTPLTTVTNISFTEYNRFTLILSDRQSSYVRIRNLQPARVCLDELMVAQPGAGVAFSNVTNAPSSPTSSQTVTVSGTITPVGSASNHTAKVWYRTGSTGVWAFVTMTKSGNNFTSSPIPAGRGDRPGGAGTVEYYLESSYLGYDSAFSSPLTHPQNGSNSPLNYVVQSSWLLATNATTEPAIPLAGRDTRLRVTLQPKADATAITPTAYYRFGTSGTFQTLAMSALSNDIYQTTTALPAQPQAGIILQYYFSASFGGADPTASPTFYPSNAPTSFFSALYMAAPYTSRYTAITVTGNVVKSMTLMDDNRWRAILTVTNVTTPTFRFSGAGNGNPTWSDLDQGGNSLPLAGTAETSGVPILLSGTYSDSLLWQFNDTNGYYTVQRVAYAGTHAWSDNFIVQTNALGWVLGGRGSNMATTDVARVFDGPFMVLRGGSSEANFLQSPEMTNRVGEVSFFYRNWYDDASRSISFVVETASSALGPWTTNSQVVNILTPDWRFFSTVISNQTAVRYVRIRNTSSVPDDRLCLDEAIVSDGGAYVQFSELGHLPASPTIVDEVTVSVTIEPKAGASDISPLLWYKAGTSSYGYYESTTMQNISGNLYRGTIPMGPIGPMFYYVQSEFSGFYSESSSPSTFPENGPGGAYSYTNLDAALSEDFELWPQATSRTNLLINDWLVYNTFCRGDKTMFYNYFASPGSTNKAIWFTYRYASDPLSFLITPVISNLYGVVHFSFMMRNMRWNGGDYQNDIAIYTTQEENPVADPSDSQWTYRQSLSSVSTNWTSSGTIDYTNNNFRIMILKFAGPEYLGIDQVTIAQRSSMITFTNLLLSPGYPSTNEPVTVSCEIKTLEPGMPAYNFSPTLYFKNEGTTYQTNLMMRQNGTNVFSAVIPASVNVWDKDTSFYIVSKFDGYYHTDNLNRSPMYYPSDYSVAPFTYRPRIAPSDFSSMVTSVTSGNGGASEMDLLTMYVWQGILTIDELVNGMTFVFKGYDHFDGTGFSPIFTNWGIPDYHWKTNLPLADLAVMKWDDPIVAAGNLQGEYVTRIHERTGEFSLRACVAQAFEAWPPSTKYTLSGNSSTEDYSLDFNDWPTNAVRTKYEDFETGWTNGAGQPDQAYYPTNWFGGAAINSWGIDDASVSNGVGSYIGVNRSRGAVLSSNINFGAAKNSQGDTYPLEGVGTISFTYRNLTTNMLPATLQLLLAAIPDYDKDFEYMSLFAEITNIVDGYNTSNFTFNVNTSGYCSVRIQHTAGAGRVVLDNLKFTDFAATYYETNGWKASEIWVDKKSGIADNPTNYPAIEFDGRRFNTNAFLQSPIMPDGIGFFSFYYKSATNTQSVSFDVWYYKGNEINNEPTRLVSVTNNNTTYLQYSMTLMTTNGEEGFVRIIPTSTNRLFIDNVRITGRPSPVSWEANNARVVNTTDPQSPGRRFRGNFISLNNGSDDIDTANILRGEWPYVRTPQFEKGIGEVSFWYRHYDVTPTGPATLHLQKSPDAANWTTFAVIPNIMNTGYLYYRTNLYDRESCYVRIINATNVTAKRVLLDELLVAEPMAADLRITNLRVSPEAPVTTNQVHVYADVQDKFLYPTNLSLWYDYSVGSTYGNWTSTNSGNPMILVGSNVANRTWTYRSEDPIQGTNADSFVMYQVRAEFDGLYANGNTSPKTGRDFTEPSFYYPLTLNNWTNIPYYIVLSVPTNAVWINEIDPGHAEIPVGTPNLYDFVEVAGGSGINLSNWKILFLSHLNPTQVLASYTIPSGTILPNTTNGFGFYLLGTNTLPVSPTQLLTNAIPYPGGVALQRPSGIYNDKLCYANDEDAVWLLTLSGFKYIGPDQEGFADMGPVSIKLTGTGTVSTAFTWTSMATWDYEFATPLAVNGNQDLIYTGGPANEPPAEVQIVDFWFAEQKVWLTVTGTNSWLPSPWYTTNLALPGSWTNVESVLPNPPVLDTSDWTYTINFPIPTNSRAYFYKVVTTNAP